jgi:uncharacterized protein (DUF1684 family)
VISRDDALDLVDYRRRVNDAYRRVRLNPDSRAAWEEWVEFRADLYSKHPQSPVPEEERGRLRLQYFDYDPNARVVASPSPADARRYEIGTSGGGSFTFTRFAIASFEIFAQRCSLDLYWLEGYGGGLFVPFRDGTSGHETYGAGRYLLDTVKGADLGTESEGLVFDFNFAYQPSCAYDPKWVCPLAPEPNHVPVEVRAGERISTS